MVSRDSIRIDILSSSLHGVDITSIDMDNSYLNAPCAENIWFVCDNECMEEKGRVMIIVRALYGLKFSGFLWRSDLVAALREIESNPTMADPKFWIMVAMRPDGYEYYEILLVCFDNFMLFPHLCD